MWQRVRKIWQESLWVRLTAAFALIIFLGASGVIVLVNQVTTRQFEVYVTRDSARWAQWLAPQLAAYYRTSGSWEGVEQFLVGSGGMPMMMPMMMGVPAEEMERLHRRMMGQDPMMGDVDMWTGMGLRVVVADADGRVVADTGGEWTGNTMPAVAWELALPIALDGTVVGKVLVTPLAAGNTPEQLFLETVTRAVVWVALGISVLALGIAAFIARQITAPLRRLAMAAYRVARGDLTVRVPVEGQDDLARVSLAFNRMAVALEAQQRLRRQLMNDIAHELRTPLSVIQAQAEALLDGVFPPTPENIQPIYEQTQLLTRLVNDLRELALAEAGELDMAREPLDMREVIRQAAASMQSAARNKGIHLVVDLPDTPLIVRGDGQRLEQVLLNLLSNALRHTPHGGTVTVRAWEERDHVYCQVRDTGPGIPPDQLPFVFERFWRGDRSRSRETGGTGLGLAIARKWVEAHGGRIWAESPPGEGAVFTFWLPKAHESVDLREPEGR